MSRILSALFLTFCFSIPAFSANLAFMNDTAGQYFTDQDWRMFGANVQHVLDKTPDGKKETWINAKTGNGGSLTPLQTVKKYGMTCRNIQIINRARGWVDQYKFMYCRSRSGWKIQQNSQ